jgi:DNA-binding NarL/FixJ family response regulator
MNISVRTVEGHRAQIFLKLGVDSLIELAHQAASANMPLAEIDLRPPT